MPKPPSFPTTHFPSLAEFGDFMWGDGPGPAAIRLETITLAELKSNGVTAAIAESWRDFYALAVHEGLGADAAPIRKLLMEKCVELLISREGGANG